MVLIISNALQSSASFYAPRLKKKILSLDVTLRTTIIYLIVASKLLTCCHT